MIYESLVTIVQSYPHAVGGYASFAMKYHSRLCFSIRRSVTRTTSRARALYVVIDINNAVARIPITAMTIMSSTRVNQDEGIFFIEKKG